MREILFRGKRIDNGEWVDGFYLCFVDEHHYILEPKLETNGECSSLKCNRVDPATVGQYTGLYDSTKWEDLTDAEKLGFYHQHYISEDGMSVRFQCIDDVKPLWRGKRIFEGDIVYSVYSKKNYPVLLGEFSYTNDYGDEERACGWFNKEPGNEFRTAFSSPEDWAVVVGNIHDNPELLEGGANDG